MYARERLDEAGEERLVAERHARWALALAERERGSPRLDREAPNLRAALDTLLARGSSDALRLASRCCRSGCAGSISRRRGGALPQSSKRPRANDARAPRRCSPRRRSSFRSGTLAAGLRARRGELRRRLRDRRHASRVAGAAVPRRVRNRERLGRGGGALARARARAGAQRALRSQPRRSASTRSASRIGSSAILRAPTSLVAESIELFRAREGTPDTIPSPLNIAEIRMSQPGGRAGLRHIFEDTLQPLLEISCGAAVSYALANQAGIARVRGDLDPGAGAARRERLRVSRRQETTPGSRRFLSVGRTSR